MKTKWLRVLACLCVSGLCGTGLAENVVLSKLSWKGIESHEGKDKEGKPYTKAQTLEAKVVVPAGHEKRRWVFEDDRAGGNFRMSINGVKVAEFVGPFVRVSLPEGALKAGENTVTCYVSREYDGFTSISAKTNPFRDLLKNMKFNPKWPWGNFPLTISGGARFVELADPTDLREAWAETSVREKKITIRAKVSTSAAHEGVLECTIKDLRGARVLHFKTPYAFKPGEEEVSFSSPWENPKLWDVGQPNLYMAEVRVLSKLGAVVDAIAPFRFGFREVWTEGRNVMLNGHPFHMRYDYFLGLNETNLGFFQYLGRNTYYYQPHGNFWWGDWGPTARHDTEVLDMCDTHGIVAFYPAVGVTNQGELFDRALHESYKQNLEGWIRLFRNRPCILAWAISMNSYNPSDSIAPDKMGRREKPRSGNDGWARKQFTVDTASKLCKEVDPTRLVYGHADGPFGDISTANCYPNMTPLQEVEEYPSKWAEDGEMPWAAVEYGVFDGSFFKDGSMLLTEHAATYFGEKAYDRETLEQLEKTMDFGLRTWWLGHIMLDEVVLTTDLYWDYMRLFTSGTDKYWRAYGVLGWNHFFWGRYGQHLLPEWKKGQWKSLPKTSATEAPEWASPQVEINRVNMQPLLAFIGGETAYPDKTHLYTAGEVVRKNAVVVWDGANPIKVNLMWAVQDAKGRIVSKGGKVVTAEPGRTLETPIAWQTPRKGPRAEYTLLLKATSGAQGMTDSFAFSVFPPEKPVVKAAGNVYFYDPREQSSWVREMLPSAKAFAPGQHLQPGEVLILGREALRVNSILPYHMEDVEKGARVVILEQSPIVWSAFGFRLVDMVTRLVYTTPYSGPLMNDLREEDLRYWRGTPTLLPEFKHVRDVSQPPKGVNRHGVASTVFEIPNVLGFEPLFQCEFDLRYSPLLRFRSGEGAVYYSSFDFTDRVGSDPAATRLARNVLELAMQKTKPAQRRVAESFDEKADILVNTGVADPRTDEFLKKGGIVLNIALTDEELTKRGIAFEKKKLYRAKLDGELAKVATRNMFRWRDYMEINCITEKGAQCEGIWYRRGKEIFLQVGSEQLYKRYEGKEGWPRSRIVEPSALALDLLKARVLTQLDGAADPIFAKRLSSICTSLPYETLDEWYVYGPFAVKDTGTLNKHFETLLPGEEQAIRGDMNPNPVYRLDPASEALPASLFDEATQKAEFDFRRKVQGDLDGRVDLSQALQLEERGAFVTLTHLWKEEKDCEAVFNFTFPAKAIIYLNEERVAATRNVTGLFKDLPEPPLNAISLRLKLKAGDNALTLKVVTLPGSLNIHWPQRVTVTRAIEGYQFSDITETLTSCTLYNPKGNIGYAYSYHYW